MRKKTRIFTVSAIAVLLVSGCASQEFRSLASNVLGSTGYVSGSRLNAFFDAGDNLVQAATPLTEEQEYYLGRGVAASILDRYRPLKNDRVQRYVNLVGRSVASFSDKPDTFHGYRFLVLESEEINAMAAPSGLIFLTRGFLKKLQDEDELAAVLSHEVAHVVHGHGVDAISSSKIAKSIGIIGKEAAREYSPEVLSQATELFSDSVNEISETLITSGYSRSQEYRADEYAAVLLKRAGYDSESLSQVLTRLQQLEGQATGGWYNTHPDPEDRLDELDDSGATRTQLTENRSMRKARFDTAMKGLR